MKLLFKNITLIPSGIALKNFIPVKNSIFPNVSKKHFWLYALYKYFTLPTKKLTSSDLLIIHNHWSAGYHHWLTEALVRLVNTDDFQNKTIIIPDNYPEFAFKSLNVLQIKHILKISTKYKYKVTEVTIPPNPKSGIYELSKILPLIRLLKQNLSIQESKTPYRKIYITRKTARFRKIENEQELIPILKENGFEIIDTATLSFQEQVQLFSECKMLVSIHGAGLTNCMFMLPNTQVIEFYKSDTFINYCYERLCEVLNIKFQRILCKGGWNNNTHVNETDLIVNIANFKKVLNTIN